MISVYRTPQDNERNYCQTNYRVYCHIRTALVTTVWRSVWWSHIAAARCRRTQYRPVGYLFVRPLLLRHSMECYLPVVRAELLYLPAFTASGPTDIPAPVKFNRSYYMADRNITNVNCAEKCNRDSNWCVVVHILNVLNVTHRVK